MAKFRFYSDTSERALLYRFPDVSFGDDTLVELETPEQFAYAYQLGATEEPTRTSGVDGFLDARSTSLRSNATIVPGYVHEPVFNVFPNRRKTRGQP